MWSDGIHYDYLIDIPPNREWFFVLARCLGQDELHYDPLEACLNIPDVTDSFMTDFKYTGGVALLRVKSDNENSEVDATF